MKTTICVLILVNCVVRGLAGPVQQLNQFKNTEPQIVNYYNDNYGVGPYNFEFETSDGQKREEHAQLITENGEQSQVISGSYSYVGSDGVTYTVNYTADKYGYHPEAAHIPKSQELIETTGNLKL